MLLEQQSANYFPFKVIQALNRLCLIQICFVIRTKPFIYYNCQGKRQSNKSKACF